MKKWTIISVILITIFTIVIGCQRRASTKEEIYKEFQKKIITMSSYKCIAEVEVIGNKSSHNYVFIHNYAKPDYYKLEVVEPKSLKGKTMEYKDDKIIISNPDIKDKIELPNTYDNKHYTFIGDFIKNYLQNEEINIKLSNNSLINFSIKENRRVDLVFNVSYENDIRHVRKVLSDIINNYQLIQKDPEPFIGVVEHAQNSVNFGVRVWCEKEDYWTVYYYLLEEVKIRFDEENISIPYPQMDLHVKHSSEITAKKDN